MSEVKELKPEEIEEILDSELPGWKYISVPDASVGAGKISKEFKFKDFMDSLSFVNELAPYFESVDHHADTHIMYSKVLFELQRFDIGGKVTDLDIQVAKEIERQFSLRS